MIVLHNYQSISNRSYESGIYRANKREREKEIKKKKKKKREENEDNVRRKAKEKYRRKVYV